MVATSIRPLEVQAVEVTGGEVFSLDSTLVASPWPIDGIWRPNQPASGKAFRAVLRARLELGAEPV